MARKIKVVEDLRSRAGDVGIDRWLDDLGRKRARRVSPEYVAEMDRLVEMAAPPQRQKREKAFDLSRQGQFGFPEGDSRYDGVPDSALAEDLRLVRYELGDRVLSKDEVLASLEHMRDVRDALRADAAIYGAKEAAARSMREVCEYDADQLSELIRRRERLNSKGAVIER